MICRVVRAVRVRDVRGVGVGAGLGFPVGGIRSAPVNTPNKDLLQTTVNREWGQEPDQSTTVIGIRRGGVPPNPVTLQQAFTSN